MVTFGLRKPTPLLNENKTDIDKSKEAGRTKDIMLAIVYGPNGKTRIEKKGDCRGFKKWNLTV